MFWDIMLCGLTSCAQTSDRRTCPLETSADPAGHKHGALHGRLFTQLVFLCSLVKASNLISSPSLHILHVQCLSCPPRCVIVEMDGLVGQSHDLLVDSFPPA